MRGRRLPTDWGLVVRMAATAVLTPLVVLAGVVAVVVTASSRVVVFVAIAAVVGTVMVLRERAAAKPARELSAAEAPELHAVLERLCLLADLPKPALVVEPERQPNSWIVGTGGDRYRLHLTEGLLERLDPHELEAVIAHELAHVANHDAAVMTIVGGPAAVLLGGGLRLARGGWFMIGGGLVAAAIGWVGSLGTRALSRYREFAADAGAVALTGSAAALASALTKVSEGIVAIPSRDLRAVAARDAFHLLPVARGDRLGLPNTHPSLQARIARLEKLERALHH